MGQIDWTEKISFFFVNFKNVWVHFTAFCISLRLQAQLGSEKFEFVILPLYIRYDMKQSRCD